MRQLLGPHLGGQWVGKLELLRKWQPPFVLVLQPDVEKVAQLRAACPNAIIVGRFYHEDSHYASNIAARPKEFAREIHQEIVSNPVTPLLDYVQSNNETNQDWQGIQRLNTFSLEWMALADQSGAYKCAILAFSVGNPDLPYKPGDPAGYDGRMLYWQQVLPSLNYAQRNDHILLLHAYGYPNIFAPDAAWYIYRYERQVQANLRTLGITNLEYAYGEIGIDRLIVDDKGGYKVATNDQDYVNQLLQWERDLQGQSLLLGGAIFTFGDSGGWDSYDIASTNVASMLATHYADHANEYESPSAPGANTMPVTNHLPFTPNQSPSTPAPDVPRKVDQRLINDMGIKLVDVQPTDPNADVWRLIEARWFNKQEAGGRHHIYVEAVDENGNPVADVPFEVHYPGKVVPRKTNGRRGFDAANFDMYPARNGYDLHFPGGDSVLGAGMGAPTPDGGFNAGEHTAMLFRYQRQKAGGSVQPQPQPPVTTVPIPTVPPKAKRLIWPTDAPRSQRWGENPAYYQRVLGIPYHNGIDHAAPMGTPVRAMADGEVLFVGNDPGYGNYVRLYHSAYGIHTFIAHLAEVLVEVGAVVLQGEIIGKSGASGNTAASINADGSADTSRPAPHTHTEIRLGGRDAYAEGTFGHGNGRIDPEAAMYLINMVTVGSAAPVASVAPIDPLVAEALWQVESSGEGFEDGELKIRFEAHIFEDYLKNPATFARHFRYDETGMNAWYRVNEDSPWVLYHDAGQPGEWGAFAVATVLNRTAALLSLSMGAPQIMGFNHAAIGYDTPQAMFEAFSRALAPQIMGFYQFCQHKKLAEPMRQRNWVEIVRRYNGEGLEAIYVPRLMAAYEALVA